MCFGNRGSRPGEDVPPDLVGWDYPGELEPVVRAALDGVADTGGGQQAVGPRRPRVLAPRVLLGGVRRGDAVALFANCDWAEISAAAEDGDVVLAGRGAQVHREREHLDDGEERVLDSLEDSVGDRGRVGKRR